ncbi:MAG: zinc ribbon domain-containing protein [Methanobacterium sp. ERen5]|nr:MAG: zinc ribbon domain-containing protein [Methanobacterium sp. ERen5]
MVSNEEIKRRLERKRRGLSEIQQDEKSRKYKTCPHCKFKNPEKSIFCVKCGKKLETNISIKCNTCGTINPKTAKFCIKCGNNLKTPESTNNEEEDKTKGLVEDEKTEDINHIDNNPSVESDSKVEIIQSDIKNQETVLDVDTKSNEVEDKEKPEINPIKTQGLPSSIPDQNLINQRNNKKTCKSCGAKNLKTAKFCVVCGEKFDIPPVEKSVEDTKSSENNKEEDKSVEICDPMDKIKRAKELLDIGAITPEEFESIKSKYLDMV